MPAVKSEASCHRNASCR